MDDGVVLRQKRHDRVDGCLDSARKSTPISRISPDGEPTDDAYRKTDVLVERKQLSGGRLDGLMKSWRNDDLRLFRWKSVSELARLEVEVRDP